MDPIWSGLPKEILCCIIEQSMNPSTRGTWMKALQNNRRLYTFAWRLYFKHFTLSNTNHLIKRSNLADVDIPVDLKNDEYMTQAFVVTILQKVDSHESEGSLSGRPIAELIKHLGLDFQSGFEDGMCHDRFLSNIDYTLKALCHATFVETINHYGRLDQTIFEHFTGLKWLRVLKLRGTQDHIECIKTSLEVGINFFSLSQMQSLTVLHISGLVEQEAMPLARAVSSLQCLQDLRVAAIDYRALATRSAWPVITNSLGFMDPSGISPITIFLKYLYYRGVGMTDDEISRIPDLGFPPLLKKLALVDDFPLENLLDYVGLRLLPPRRLTQLRELTIDIKDAHITAELIRVLDPSRIKVLTLSTPVLIDDSYVLAKSKIFMLPLYDSLGKLVIIEGWKPKRILDSVAIQLKTHYRLLQISYGGLPPYDEDDLTNDDGFNHTKLDSHILKFCSKLRHIRLYNLDLDHVDITKIKTLTRNLHHLKVLALYPEPEIKIPNLASYPGSYSSTFVKSLRVACRILKQLVDQGLHRLRVVIIGQHRFWIQHCDSRDSNGEGGIYDRIAHDFDDAWKAPRLKPQIQQTLNRHDWAFMGTKPHQLGWLATAEVHRAECQWVLYKREDALDS